MDSINPDHHICRDIQTDPMRKMATMAGWGDEVRGEGRRRGRVKGLRDEVDLIMKRLRIPWRERVGGQVRERESQKETQVVREKRRGQKKG